jgi:translation initiation factor IF-1
MSSKNLIKLDGIIEEALSNAMFRVRLENEHLIIATISGKMRMLRCLHMTCQGVE